MSFWRQARRPSIRYGYRSRSQVAGREVRPMTLLVKSEYQRWRSLIRAGGVFNGSVAPTSIGWHVSSGADLVGWMSFRARSPSKLRKVGVVGELPGAQALSSETNPGFGPFHAAPFEILCTQFLNFRHCASLDRCQRFRSFSQSSPTINSRGKALTTGTYAQHMVTATRLGSRLRRVHPEADSSGPCLLLSIRRYKSPMSRPLPAGAFHMQKATTSHGLKGDLLYRRHRGTCQH
jgi:hypothetical protein